MPIDWASGEFLLSAAKAIKSMIAKQLVPPHQKSSDAPEDLSAIRTTGVNLAVWERSESRCCSSAIDSLLSASEAVALDLDPAEKTEIEREVTRLVGRHGTTDAAGALALDIWNLVGLFCRIAGTKRARVRLERIQDDGCLLFHADTLLLRMLCTYAGPGTEWLENDNARYDELGSQGRSLEDANGAIVIDPSRIQRVPPWHVALFSGRLRLGTPPLIHRSCPVPTEREHRIRLCIDLPDASH